MEKIHIYNFDEYCNESFKDTLNNVVGNISSLFTSKKTKLTKLLNNENIEKEDLIDAIIDILEIEKDGKIISKVKDLNYNNALQILAKCLSMMEKTFKIPELKIINNRLQLK